MHWPAVSVGLPGSNRGSDDGRGNGSSRDGRVQRPCSTHHPHTGSGEEVHVSQLLYEPHMSTVCRLTCA